MALNSFSRTCARIAGSRKFQNTIVGVIVLNAITLGLGTYPNVRPPAAGVLQERLERLRLRRHRRGVPAWCPRERRRPAARPLLRVVRPASVLPDLRIFLTAPASWIFLSRSSSSRVPAHQHFLAVV